MGNNIDVGLGYEFGSKQVFVKNFVLSLSIEFYMKVRKCQNVNLKCFACTFKSWSHNCES